MKGIVIKSTGSWYTVRTENSKLINCKIKGKFRTQNIKNTNPVAVGDKINFEKLPNEDVGVIDQIFERKNCIVRKSVNLSKQTHILASNIDMAFLLVTIEQPETFTSFIDRFLITAAAYYIPVTILFNKIDVYNENSIQKKNKLEQIYTNIGYQCIDISSTKNINIDKVKSIMKNNTSTMFGHSGVGKSTLINTIDENLNLKTLEISKTHKLGRHTTTYAEMFELKFGGFIIDTPGIKGLGLVNINKQELGKYFFEILERQENCKFNNCLHLNEPQCAIKKALENGEISESRYYNYLSFLQDEDNYRKDIYQF